MKTAEWLWTLAAIAALGVTFAVTQPMIAGGAGHDGTYYLRMAQQIQQSLRPEAINPFVLRVGTPWLAAVAAGVSGMSLPNAFLLINVSASAIAALLFAVWLRAHVADAVTRVTLVVFFLVLPYSPFRFTFYYPALTDALAMLFLMMGLIALDRFSRRVDAGGAAALTLIVAVGCAFRELVVVIAIATLFVRPWHARPAQWVWRALPLSGILTIAAIQSWIIATPSGYSAAGAVERWLEWKTLPMMMLAVLFVFGPLMVLLLQYWRATWRDAVERPDLLVFVGIFTAAAWVGASDTERILVFAVPVVLMQVGKTLASIRIARAHGVFALLVALQLLTYRGLLPIDGPFLRFFSEYYSLFTVWLDPVSTFMFLGAYAVAIALIVVSARSAAAAIAGVGAEIQTAPGRIHV